MTVREQLNSFSKEEIIEELIGALVRSADLAKALQLQESAEESHANCTECDGEEVPELCPKCFPLFDDARIARRSALALPQAERKVET